MACFFEKVSQGQFFADGGREDDQIVLPKRATEGSAGYDFFAPRTLTVEANQTLKVATGIRCKIDNGLCLLIIPKSGLGCKYRLGLANTVGLIDSDYYFADNEGHIIVFLENRGQENVVIERGKAFVQSVFLPYQTTKDDQVKTKRKGGFGSTQT